MGDELVLLVLVCVVFRAGVFLADRRARKYSADEFPSEAGLGDAGPYAKW